jgi:hypothetical protein
MKVQNTVAKNAGYVSHVSEVDGATVPAACGFCGFF